ncbi:MAG: hypothetical protein Q9207_005472 [Kuettlingeria erythrocarpa]
MNFDDLDVVPFHHPIYDADQTDLNPHWYRHSLNTGYEFRLGPRDPDKPQPSCRIDLDESGDFDPSGKQPSQIVPIKRRRETLQQFDAKGEPIPKRPRSWTWQNGRFNGLSLPVTFTFTSQCGRAYLERLGNGSENWPVDDQSSSSSSQDSTFCSASATSSGSSLSCHNEQQYKYRCRERTEVQHHDQTDNDEFDFSNITLGHPAARGCIPCLKLGLTCTLLQEGTTYPCQDCVEDDCECELVLEPVVKRSCQGCRRRRLRCSYLEADSDHSRACRTCANIGVNCIAGPASGRTRTGPSLDGIVSTSTSRVASTPRLPVTRPFVNCTQCRLAKRWCSLRRDQSGPCNRCIADQTPCTFEALPNANIKKTPLPLQNEPQAAASTLQDVPGRQSAESNLPIPTTKSPSPSTITITTRLPHPIHFNHEPADACSWCLDLLHGLLGFGTLQPVVRDTPAGYIEISGGHTAQGYLPSRMCDGCTLDRFAVICCDGHQMQILEGANRQEYNSDTVLEALMSGTVGDVEWEWCYVCPRLATYGCGRPNDIRDEMGEGIGCGLRLCDECAIVLASECQGDLDALVAMKMTEGGDDEDDLAARADADLLLRHGELMRRAGVVEEDGR